MKKTVFRELIDALCRDGSAELRVDCGDHTYIRKFTAKSRLIILGGGHVGLALSRMAAMLDYTVVVVDDRPAFANYERFPEAEQVICDSFENAIRSLEIGSRDYVCVLTRGHRWDQHCVEAILSGEMPYYLGMIGSRRRVAGLKECLAQKGYDAVRIDRLHAPIGLPIGAQTPAEIALSICAEMVQIKRSERPVFEDNVLSYKQTDMPTLHCLADSKTPRAMLIVLRSDGSTPVESGSMMAVDALGNTFGTVGGGCSEAAAVNQARRLIGTGKSAVTEFDMSAEVAKENGMVCGGSMTVLLEDITD